MKRLLLFITLLQLVNISHTVAQKEPYDSTFNFLLFAGASTRMPFASSNVANHSPLNQPGFIAGARLIERYNYNWGVNMEVSYENFHLHASQLIDTGYFIGSTAQYHAFSVALNANYSFKRKFEWDLYMGPRITLAGLGGQIKHFYTTDPLNNFFQNSPPYYNPEATFIHLNTGVIVSYPLSNWVKPMVGLQLTSLTFSNAVEGASMQYTPFHSLYFKIGCKFLFRYDFDFPFLDFLD